MPKATEPGQIAGIVLAAGMSTRLGRPKQLVEIGGRPLVVHVVERCLASTLDLVVVVAGHEATAVKRALSGLAATIIDNPRYPEGQSTSLIAGLEAVSGANAIVVVLGDQPGIQPQAIDRLVAVRREDDALLGMAAYGAERGHPVMFGCEVFDALRQLSGDMGGRDIIQRHRKQLVLVEGGSPTVPRDLDTEADFIALRDTWKRRQER